jgi:hypothetical protein
MATTVPYKTVLDIVEADDKDKDTKLSEIKKLCIDAQKHKSKANQVQVNKTKK